jgi:hypothetical protein
MNEKKENDSDDLDDPVIKLIQINMLLFGFNEAYISDNIDLINEQIKHLQTKLIYLESRDCRNSLMKDIIESEKRDATNRFKLLINKRHKLLNMAVDTSSEEENK